eukprot:128033-Rhodomonas_salina.2
MAVQCWAASRVCAECGEREGGVPHCEIKHIETEFLKTQGCSAHELSLGLAPQKRPGLDRHVIGLSDDRVASIRGKRSKFKL